MMDESTAEAAKDALEQTDRREPTLLERIWNYIRR